MSENAANEEKPDGLLRISAPDPSAIEFTRPVPVSRAEASKRRLRFHLHQVLGLSAILVGISIAIAITVRADPGDTLLWVVGPISVLAVIIVARFVWSWRHACFCPDCGAVVSWNLSRDRLRWCAECDCLLNPQELALKNSQLVLDTPAAWESDPDDIWKMLELILLFGICGRVDEMVFEPNENGYRLYARISGDTHELEPPPPESHRRTVNASKALFGCAGTDARGSPKEMSVSSDGGDAQVVATFSETTCGEILTLGFTYPESQSPQVA